MCWTSLLASLLASVCLLTQRLALLGVHVPYQAMSAAFWLDLSHCAAAKLCKCVLPWLNLIALEYAAGHGQERASSLLHPHPGHRAEHLGGCQAAGGCFPSHPAHLHPQDPGGQGEVPDRLSCARLRKGHQAERAVTRDAAQCIPQYPDTVQRIPCITPPLLALDAHP